MNPYMPFIKKYSHYAAVLLVVGMGACSEKYLDVTPKDQVSDLSVWTDPINADVFLNEIYNQLPDLNNEAQVLEQWTDNSFVGADWMTGRQSIWNAAVSASNYPPSPMGLFDWTKNYSNIRKCNLFIEKVTASATLTPEYKQKRIPEVRFLRAFFYHYLWMAHGGVPIITDVLNNETQGEGIFRARNTDAETAKFIIDELGAIADQLPTSLTTADQGRPSKWVALTLKGWVELYAASPLRNPSNDVAKWQQAAATNKQIIDQGPYNLVADFGTIWLPEQNNGVESIFAKQYKALVKGGHREGYMGPVYVKGAQQAWGNLQPTQELVDDFSMDNGLPITDPASGYNPQNPYVNREKRFYQTIIYDGAPWQGDIILTRKGVGSQNEIDLGSANDVTNTGYYARKTLDERITAQDNIALANGAQNYIFFRFADVLLNYAEAQNEAAGPDASVYGVIKRLRARSIDPAKDKLSLSLSQNEMRTLIHRERRVEFAFEDKRWFDVLRWKMAGGPNGVFNKDMHAMLIEDPNKDGTFTYTKVVSYANRKWDDRMYLMPIPASVLDQNPKIRPQQNPGY
ncbi:MAG: RagB/SusD family nutrient uptake outer membrane protein [Bacteroidota bacterium]